LSEVSRWSYTNTATVWPVGAKDHLNGGNQWGEPYQIACTWIADTKVMKDNGGKEFVSSCAYFHEDARVKHGDRIAKGVYSDANPVGLAEEIKAHRDWDMSMFTANGAPDIPDFRSAV
jgi:hypothetical protein